MLAIIIINNAVHLQIHVRNLACLSQALDNALITSYSKYNPWTSRIGKF